MADDDGVADGKFDLNVLARAGELSGDRAEWKKQAFVVRGFCGGQFAGDSVATRRVQGTGVEVSRVELTAAQHTHWAS